MAAQSVTAQALGIQDPKKAQPSPTENVGSSGSDETIEPGQAASAPSVLRVGSVSGPNLKSRREAALRLLGKRAPALVIRCRGPHHHGVRVPSGLRRMTLPPRTPKVSPTKVSPTKISPTKPSPSPVSPPVSPSVSPLVSPSKTKMADERISALEAKCEALSDLVKKLSMDVARLEKLPIEVARLEKLPAEVARIEKMNTIMHEQIDVRTKWTDDQFEEQGKKDDRIIKTFNDSLDSMDLRYNESFDSMSQCFSEMYENTVKSIGESFENVTRSHNARYDHMTESFNEIIENTVHNLNERIDISAVTQNARADGLTEVLNKRISHMSQEQIMRTEHMMKTFNTRIDTVARDSSANIANISHLSLELNDCLNQGVGIARDSKNACIASKKLKEDMETIRSRLNATVTSQGDLNSKLNLCLPRIWDGKGQSFAEAERRQLALLEEALEELQKEQAAQKKLILRLKIGLTMAFPEHPLSLTRVAQEDEMAPGVTSPGVPPFIHPPNSAQENIAPGAPASPASPNAPSARSTPTTPTTPTLSKQKSIHNFSLKRSAGKPNVDPVSPQSPPRTTSASKLIKEANERSMASDEPSKRWNFGFRNRRDAEPSSPKSPLAVSPRHPKQGDDTAEHAPGISMGATHAGTSSVPSSPTSPTAGYPMSMIHPAFRSTSSAGAQSASAALRDNTNVQGHSEATSPILAEGQYPGSMLQPAFRSSSAETVIHIPSMGQWDDDTIETIREVISLPGSGDPSPTESSVVGGSSLPHRED
ncbi:hypothetical protein N7541_000315 [Penicillium brevicompactum]|uniref:Uncharacterized protein n=1 Tax=Penicillium brevicompactum TaxID=5074 RepID=A0A9W9RW20_PENBR|nr:hypothetical protein N7541_000315 [Penicillium brevicompactum]